MWHDTPQGQQCLDAQRLPHLQATHHRHSWPFNLFAAFSRCNKPSQKPALDFLTASIFSLCSDDVFIVIPANLQFAGYVHLGHQQERINAPAIFLQEGKMNYWSQNWHQPLFLLPACLPGSAVAMGVDQLGKPSAWSEGTGVKMAAQGQLLSHDLTSVLCISLQKNGPG